MSLLTSDNSFGAGYYGIHHGNNFGYHGGHRGYNRSLHQQWNSVGYERHNGNFGYGHNNYRDNSYGSRQPITIVINNQGACYENGGRRSGYIGKSESLNFEVQQSEPYVFKYNEKYKPGANAFVFNAKDTGSDDSLSSGHGDVFVFDYGSSGKAGAETQVPVLNSLPLLADNN